MDVVFITGGTGLIGRHLLEEMVKNEDISVIWSLYRSQVPFVHEKIKWIKGDMDHLPEIPSSEKITKVIHAAALMERYTAKGDSPKRLYESNIRWTENMIAFCRRYEVNELIYFSSINVRLKHIGVYSRSKLQCEKLIRESGLKTKIVRPALVYGKGKNGLTTLMHYIRSLPVVPVFGNGRAKEQPIFVTDLAKLVICCMMDHQASELVELCGKEPMEYDAMVRLMAQTMGRKARIIHLPFRPFYYSLLLLEKLNIALPVSPEQVAHISEDLVADMSGICKRYQISLTDFAEGLKSLD